MAGALYRLLYCSRNVIAHAVPAGQAVDMEREIRAILDVARRRNKADNVTGALLFTASGFAQVLEGSRETVERTFERIGADPRHADVSVLSFTPIERRGFPDWAMGFCGDIRSDRVDPLAHLLSDATFTGERASTGGDLLRLLERLVRREDEWIAA
ncbi:BLUF domain-containing protein [Rhodopila sp.]|uniref:BLUF domain-containing protein n=1 Tax=Rhodopila sp. TaxID=2480087 RepID=UPI003D0C6FEE